MEKLTDNDIKQILFLHRQGNGRCRLIKNLFRLEDWELQTIIDAHF